MTLDFHIVISFIVEFMCCMLDGDIICVFDDSDTIFIVLSVLIFLLLKCDCYVLTIVTSRP